MAESALQLESRNILILYGSETGNSQDSAEDVSRLAERLHFETRVCEMNEIVPQESVSPNNITLIAETLRRYCLVIFIISTTGQGELPKNARVLWRNLLYKNLDRASFLGVDFTTFGLGDSSYAKYNYAARKLHKRLKDLSATEVFPRGEGNERHDDGIDGTFIPWCTRLQTFLLSQYPLPDGLTPIPPDVHLPPKIVLEPAPIMALGRPDMSEVDMQDGQKSGIDAITGGDPQNLDRKAARFSHVDAANPELDEFELRQERMRPGSMTHVARLSEHTANMVQGGIDTLDRPNVLRDAPSKYLLDDPADSRSTPPAHMLPIPHGWTATLMSNERVTPENHWQDVRRLTFHIHLEPKKSKKAPRELNCLPGDVMVIYPKNFPEDVQALIDLMGWNDVADKPFIHYSKRRDGIPIEHVPKNCYPLRNSTLRQLLTHNYDITAIPKRVFFDHIKFFTDDPMHREKLGEFADPKHTDEFYDYTSRPRRSILEVLQDFPSVKVPYQWVASIFPIIRGREYSIASGGALLDDHGDLDEDYIEIDILVALVKYKTVLRKTRKGLCSRYIESLEPDTEMCVKLEHHQQPEDDIRRPMIGIATGTGIAPIRALLWNRSEVKKRAEEFLFFGCRNKNADFYFADEWQKLGVKVFPAFSRDQRDKVYVQDVIRREAETVLDLVRKGAIICLCGSSGKMPEAVRKALVDVLIAGGNDEQVSKKWLERNLWEEVW